MIAAAVEAAVLRRLAAGRIPRAAKAARLAAGPLRAATGTVGTRRIAQGGERRAASGRGAALAAVPRVAMIDELPAARGSGAAAAAAGGAGVGVERVAHADAGGAAGAQPFAVARRLVGGGGGAVAARVD